MSLVPGLEVLRAGNRWQEPGGWRGLACWAKMVPALPCGQVFRWGEEGEATLSGGESRKREPVLIPSRCLQAPRLYHISVVV